MHKYLFCLFLFIFLARLTAPRISLSANRLSYYNFEGTQTTDEVFGSNYEVYDYERRMSVARTTNHPHAGNYCARVNLGTIGYDGINSTLCRPNPHIAIGSFNYGHEDNYGQHTDEQAFYRFWFRYDENVNWHTQIKLFHGGGHNFNDQYSGNYNAYNTPALSPVSAPKPHSIWDSLWHKVEIYHKYAGSNITDIQVWVDNDLIMDLDADDFNQDAEGNQLYPQRTENFGLIHEHTWHFYSYVYRYNDYYSVSHLSQLDELLWTTTPYSTITRDDNPEEVTLFENNTDYYYIRCYSSDYMYNEIVLKKEEWTGIGERRDGHYAQGAGRLFVEFWNGSDWQEVENINDSTAVSGNTLEQDGSITWTAPTTETWRLYWNFISNGGYRWIRLHVQNNPLQGLKADMFIPQYSLGMQLDDIEIWDGLPDDRIPIAGDSKMVLAYPNPAHEKVTFIFTNPTAQNIVIQIFNFAGERVASIKSTIDENNPLVEWHLVNIASGVYIYQVESNGKKIQTDKIAIKK